MARRPQVRVHVEELPNGAKYSGDCILDGIGKELTVKSSMGSLRTFRLMVKSGPKIFSTCRRRSDPAAQIGEVSCAVHVRMGM